MEKLSGFGYLLIGFVVIIALKIYSESDVFNLKCIISGVDGNYSLIKMASGEVRKINSRCMATIGVLSNPDQKNIKIGKAGRSRWLGIRHHTRGVVKNPVDHPHGGGEGKSAGGRHPVSPTGQSAKGLKTRDNKRTDKFIIRRRRKKRA